MGFRTIEASEFKAKCLSLMDEVSESGEELVITKHGRPIARLVPFGRKGSPLAFGRNRENIRILGNIVSPMPAEWFAESEDTGQDLFDTPGDHLLLR